MNKLLAHRSLIRENLALLAGVCLCFYFSYHALQGNRSFVRLLGLDSSIAALSERHAALETERAALEARVKMMRPGSLDRDLLEERVRAVLGYRRPDELELRSN